MKKVRTKKWSVKAVATLMVMIFAMSAPCLRIQAEELTENVKDNTDLVTMNVANEGYSAVQPLTTMVDCEIVLAFTMDGLRMTFSTSSVKISSVIGVKDIKVQQKMWYGWKTVFTSEGAEDYNEDIFIGELTYPDAVNGKTYRVTCVHYANYDVYEEVENDTGSFKFII